MRKRCLWLISILPIAIGLIWFGYSLSKREVLYQEAKIALSNGDKEKALIKFFDLGNLAPNYQDTSFELQRLTDELIPQVPLFNVGAEARLIKWLTQQNDCKRLVKVLNQSRVPVLEGEFWMGSDDHRNDERPFHQVYLNGFAIDRYEITNTQYQIFIKDSGRPPPIYWTGQDYPVGMGAMPVVGVSWPDADAYCRWAGGRLPTEAEWEKACRGTGGSIYPWGNEWNSDLANVDISQHHQPTTPIAEWVWNDWWKVASESASGKGHPRIEPVGSYPAGASPYGVQDMIGNAAEWVLDYYNWGDYSTLPEVNPVGDAPPWNHVTRGGSWLNPNGNVEWTLDLSRCSARSSSHASQDDPRQGFRCVVPLP